MPRQEMYHARREIQLLDRWFKESPAGYRMLNSPDGQYYICLNEQEKIVLKRSRGMGIPNTLQTCGNAAEMEAWLQSHKHAPLAQWMRNV